MPLEISEFVETLKKLDLHYGGIPTEDYKSYSHVDIWTGPLGIGRLGEYKLAEKIAEKYGLKLIQQDFSRGEDEPAKYHPVFAASCDNSDQLKTSLDNLQKACDELTSKIEKLVEHVFNL